MRFLPKLGSRSRIVIIGGLAVLGIIALGARLLSSGAYAPRGSESAAATAIPVTAALAIRQDVPNIISTIGTVQSIDSVAIQPQVSGPIVKIEFQPGQDVKRGQELFLIDPRPYEAALDQAKAQLAHDEAVLAEAQLDLIRYQTLAKENSIAKQQAQDQAFVVEQDKGSVALDQANVDTAQINLDYCHIKSPIDGRAGILLVELGNVVGPNTAGGAVPATGATTAGTTANAGTLGQTAISGGLVSVTQIKPIYVSFPVAETLFDEVRRQQAAEALQVDAYAQSGKLIAQGKLTVIDNQVNASTGTVMMQATFANADEALWPGEFVRVQLIVSMRQDVVTLPAQAVMAGASGSYIYVIGADQTVHRVDVQVAARQGGIVVIEKGVSDGEKVVTDGQYRLADGAKVAVRRTTEAGVALR